MVTQALPLGDVVDEWGRDATGFPVSVETFLTLMHTGAIDARTELLDGWMKKKMPGDPPHASTQRKLIIRLLRALPEGWLLNPEQPIELAGSVPLPDIVVMRGGENDYDFVHPLSSDIGLAIEVSDSTVTTDRRNKLRLYAADAIAVVWLVSIPDRRIEVYSNPDPVAHRYTQRTDYAESESVPLVLDGVTIAALRVGDVLPLTQ